MAVEQVQRNHVVIGLNSVSNSKVFLPRFMIMQEM